MRSSRTDPLTGDLALRAVYGPDSDHNRDADDRERIMRLRKPVTIAATLAPISPSSSVKKSARDMP